jgi:predicted Zn-dependent peptidase
VPGTLAVHHQTPVSRTPHCWLIDRPGAVQADIRLGGFGIDRGDPRWADLQVATHALGGAFLSRLNRVLREEKGFTYGVHLVNSPMRDGGLLAVQGSFRTDVVVEALDLARRLLAVTGKPITNQEVLDAVNYTNGIAPLRYSTAQGVTERVASLVAAGLSAEFVNSNALALTRVTPESATQAISELLPPDALTLVVVGDAAALRDPLVAAGWPVTLKP